MRWRAQPSAKAPKQNTHITIIIVANGKPDLEGEGWMDVMRNMLLRSGIQRPYNRRLLEKLSFLAPFFTNFVDSSDASTPYVKRRALWNPARPQGKSGEKQSKRGMKETHGNGVCRSKLESLESLSKPSSKSSLSRCAPNPNPSP